MISLIHAGIVSNGAVVPDIILANIAICPYHVKQMPATVPIDQWPVSLIAVNFIWLHQKNFVLNSINLPKR